MNLGLAGACEPVDSAAGKPRHFSSSVDRRQQTMHRKQLKNVIRDSTTIIPMLKLQMPTSPSPVPP
jgi:hypothetical protein